MNRTALPNFSNQTVIVVGSGPSLKKLTPDLISKYPSVGCNSTVQYFHPTIWCSAHADNIHSVKHFIMTDNFDCAMYIRAGVTSRGTTYNNEEEAKRILPEHILKKLFWMDRHDVPPKVLSEDTFLIRQGGWLSGILALEIAITLGANKLILFGYDYDDLGHWDGSAVGNRSHTSFLEHHFWFFSGKEIEVDYRGQNPKLIQFHKLKG